MTRIDVLYFVEHVARELDIACAIKRRLEREHGLAVEIASLAYGLHNACLSWRPRLIASPYFYSGQDAFLKDVLISFPGVPVVNLAFEQLFSAANKKYKRPRDEAARRGVLHLAAGKFFRSFLLESGVEEANVEIVGSLALALARPPYRALYEGARDALAERHGLDRSRKWLFFPENYAAAFFSPGDLAKRRQGGFSAHDLESYVDFTRQSFQQVMRWCVQAARDDLCEIIIRPRPAIAAADFQQALLAAVQENAPSAVGDRLPSRLHLIKDGTVREWMLASDMTVSSYSSTVVEAAAAGRPVCLAAPLPFPESVLADWNHVAPLVRSEREFREFAKSGGAGVDCRPLIDWANENLFPHSDPIARAADVLAEVCSGRRALAPPPAASRSSRWKLYWKHRRRSWQEAWRRRMHSVDRAAKTHEQDCFTADDIARRIALWDQALGQAVPSSTAARAAA